MPATPTEEGSIVAYLRLDDSDWREKLDQAKAAADELDRVDPRIRVSADTADAEAKLLAVRDAAETVGGDQTRTVTTVSENVDRTVSESTASDDGSTGARSMADAAAAQAESAADDRLIVARVGSASAAAQAAEAADSLAQSDDSVTRVVDLSTEALEHHDAALRASGEAALALSDVEAQSSELVDNVTAARQAATDALDATSSASERATVAESNLQAARRMAEQYAEGYSTSLIVLGEDTDDASISASRLAQSQRDAREAFAGSEAAASALAAAEKDLADAQRAAGGGDAGTGGKSKGGAGGGHFAVRPTLIGSAIVAGVAALGPVAGYVAGVGGAFAGMGVAGVLAIEGITRAMADGSAQGQQYAGLMGTLDDDLHQLEDNAAAGLLQPFTAVVSELNTSMPQLNTEIDGFAHDLGQVGSTVVDTLISGFQTLNPLFAEGAQYIQHLASEWSGWVNDGGLNRFAADAEQSLPLVGADLGNLATIAMHLIDGLAPLGTVVLTALEAVSGVIAALPVPVLIGAATAAAAVFGEVKLWAALQPIITTVGRSFEVLGAEEDAALGPIGLVAAAVTALGLGVASGALSMQQASEDTQNYTLALQQSNGVIDENIRQTAAKNLQDQGVLDTARQYGLSLSVVTDAALGNAAAQQAVNNAIQLYGTYMKDVGRGQDDAFGTQQTALYSKAQKLIDVVDGQSKSFDNAMQAYKNISAASSTTTSAQALLASEASQVSTALATQGGFATSLTNDLNLLNGISLNNVQAATAQAAAINAVRTSFTTYGRSIDGTSAAAVANQQAIESAVTAIDNRGKAVTTATGSQERGTQAILAGRTALEQQLQAQHDLTPAVQAFIDTVLQIPTKRNVDIAVNTVNAVNAIDGVSNLLAGLRHPTIDLSVVEHTYGVGILGSGVGTASQMNIMHHAAGGTVGGFGSNSSDSMLSWLSRSEEVISNMDGQASRYRPLLKTINANQSPTAVMAAAQATTGVHGGVVNNYYQHTWHVTAQNPEQMLQYFTSQTNRLNAV